MFFSFGLYAQNGEEEMTKKERRQAKKEQRQQEYAAKQAKALKMLQDKDIVLEANLLLGQKGETVQASPNINFIAISGEDIHMQLGSANGIGWNGVGGVTFDGKMSVYEIYENEKSGVVGVRIRYTNLLSRDVITIDLSINGDRASARVNTAGRILTMQGNYMTAAESTVFKADNIRNY